MKVSFEYPTIENIGDIASEGANFHKEWYKNGLLHREGGPALEKDS